jgi:hypothetical protein
MEHSMSLAMAKWYCSALRWRNGWLEEGSSESCAWCGDATSYPGVGKTCSEGIVVVLAVRFEFLGSG